MYAFTMQSLAGDTGVMIVPFARLPENLDELIRWLSQGFGEHYGISAPVMAVLPQELEGMPMGEALRAELDKGMRTGKSLGLRKKSNDGKMLFSIQHLMKPFGAEAGAN